MINKREIAEKAYGTYERNKLMRFLYANGTRQRDLARAFKLTRQAVNAIIKRGSGSSINSN